MTRRRAEFVRANARGRILDVGSGPGQLAQQLERSFMVLADISFKILKVARQRSGQTDLVVCDAEYLPFSKCAFDTVIGSEVIYYLSDPSRFLKGVARVLRGRGQIILLWGNKLYNVFYWFAGMVGLRPMDPYGSSTPSSRTVRQMLLAELSFTDIDQYGVGFPLSSKSTIAKIARYFSPVHAVVSQIVSPLPVCNE